MTCPYCAEAEQRPDYPCYQAQCLGCSVRALAHSPMFYFSGQAGSIRPEYRKALQQLGDWQEIHALVKEQAARIKDYRQANPD